MVGSGRSSTQLTLPCAPRSGVEKNRAERAGGTGFQLPLTRLLAGSAALRSARPLGRRFQSWPAPPPAPARPQPRLRPSPLPISRAQHGLRLPPDACNTPLLFRSTGPTLSAAWC